MNIAVIEQMLTTKEAAALFGYVPHHLRDILDEIHLPCYQFGKQLRFRRSDVDKILAEYVRPTRGRKRR